MNKKVCLISDVHWGKKKGALFMLNSMENYFMKELIPYLIENEIKKLFILGDFFDTRTSVDVRVSNVVFSVLNELKKNDIEVLILLGNHDVFFNTSNEIHSLRFFELFDNITVISSISEMNIFGVDCTFFPWQTDNIFQSKKYKGEIAFGHFAINGCKLNKKQVNEGGNDQSFFHKNFKMTFTGHFHEPSTYKSGKKEITYIGCPYHLDRNDSNGDRGVIVLDFETQKWERVYSKNTLKYIVIPFGTDLTKVEIPNNIIDIHVNVKHDFDSKKINNYVELIESYEGGAPLSVNVITHYDYSETGEDINQEDISKVKSIPDMVKAKLEAMDFSSKIKKEVFNYINAKFLELDSEKI